MENPTEPSMGLISKFIVVDDDSTNNLICELTLKKVIPEAEVKLFTDPEQALSHIREEVSASRDGKKVLLLDINMPEITGWDFMDAYATIEEDVRQNFLVYMVSSSVDLRDKLRAESNPLIRGFVSKPLRVDFIRQNFRSSS